MNGRPPPATTREYASVEPTLPSRAPIGRLGDYRLLRKLGQGGMGEIFLAKRIGVGGFEKAVVLKCMLDSLSGSQEFVGMFFDEAHLAARLSHPNIAQIYDFGVAEGRYYIAMEHIAGEDLTAIISHLRERRAHIPVELAARIMIDVCSGLEYAHTLAEEGRALHIIHRDVSPANIMVSYQGAVKLLDFGIAKATSRVSETRSGSIKGKLSFLAPELIRGMDPDPRADLFSLGISLFALLTKQHPFRRDTELATLHAITDSDAPDPRELRPDLPDDLVAVVRKALERDRDKRFASAAHVGAALQEVMAHHAPATGSAELAAFLATLFGEERRDEKSRIPTLARPNLEAVVTPQPTLVTFPPSPLLEPTAPSRDKPPNEDLATRLDLTVPPAPDRRQRPAWVSGALIGLGLLLAAVGGALLMQRSGAQDPPSPPMVAQPPAPPPAPAPALGPQAETSPKPPPPAPTPRSRARGPRPAAAPIEPLSEKALHTVVQKAHPRFVACMRDHAAELPGGTGQVKIEIAVAGSGAVSSARAALPGSSSPALASCLEREARRLRFARHPDQEIRFAFPLVYRRGQ